MLISRPTMIALVTAISAVWFSCTSRNSVTRDHELVGDGIEKLAERRTHVPAPRDPAVEPVGDRGGDEDRRGRDIRAGKWRVEDDDHDRQQQDPEQGQGGRNRYAHRSSSMKRSVDALGKIPTDSTDAHEFLDSSLLQTAQATEVLEQRRAPVRSDARNLLKTRRFARALATAPVARDRKTVRLVAHRLEGSRAHAARQAAARASH